MYHNLLPYNIGYYQISKIYYYITHITTVYHSILPYNTYYILDVNIELYGRYNCHMVILCNVPYTNIWYI